MSSIMKAGIAAGVLAFLVVAVLAIWPVVADAPWEDTATPVVEGRTDEIRCEGALELRQAATTAIGNLQPGPRGISVNQMNALQDQLRDAEREIARYC